MDVSPSARFFVRIGHLTPEELVFFGWVKTAEDDEFAIYSRPYSDEEQVVEKADPFLLVDDVNDAIQMTEGEIVLAPTQDDKSDPTKRMSRKNGHGSKARSKKRSRKAG